jgi:hypothetical protein
LENYHKDEVPEMIKLAQYALTLPLHTCNVPKEKKYSVSHSLMLSVISYTKRMVPVYDFYL